MGTRLNKILKSEIIKSFIRYAGIFSLIFTAMTVIIVQIMSASVYQSTDERLKIFKGKPYEILYLAHIRDVFGGGGSKPVKEGDPFSQHNKELALYASSSSHAILFDRDHNILNNTDPVLGLAEIKPNFVNLDVIQEIEVRNSFDTIDSYRYILVEAPEEIESDLSVAYAMVLVNTTQFKIANEENKKIIVLVMAAFWSVSILAAVGLTVMTVKPIRAAYEQQKTFVENASHELRTPLAVLQNRLESLFHKPEATIMDEFESIASSLDEVRNMRILTNNLLSLAKRDRHLTITLEEVNPDFFEAIFDNYALIATEQDKHFIGKNLVNKIIKTDITLIKQILTILFDNAIKYTESEIYITSRIRNRYLVVIVEDNGGGIADEDKKKIFDRFYRVDKARTRKNGGLGLGLSLAKQIVDGLDGQILVQDRTPQGSIFEVKIPLK